MYEVRSDDRKWVLEIYEEDDILQDLVDSAMDGNLVVPPFKNDDIYYTTKVLSNVTKQTSYRLFVIPSLAFIIKQEGLELLKTLRQDNWSHLFVPPYVVENQFDKLQAWDWQGELEGIDLLLQVRQSQIGGTVWERHPSWYPVVRVEKA
jgi:hypothetical protein